MPQEISAPRHRELSRGSRRIRRESLTGETGAPTLAGILMRTETGMDTTAAARQPDGLHVVTPDGCTVAGSTALQGSWTQAQYLKLTNWSNRLLEFTDGRIEVLPTSTQEHQAISRFLFLALYSFVRNIGGKVFYAPLAPPHP